jgi:hypothetical protein
MHAATQRILPAAIGFIVASCQGPLGVEVAIPTAMTSTVDEPPALTELEQAAKLQWRWIAALDLGQDICPEAPYGWSGSNLFAESPAQIEDPHDPESEDPYDPQLPLPQGLARYCVYETSEPDLSGPPDVGLADIAPDTMAVDRMGTALDGHAFDGWYDTFRREAGQAGLGPANDLAAPVRLAVVDSYPTTEPSTAPRQRWGHSWHGYSLVHMARTLTCGVGAEPMDCVAAISTRLALQYSASHPTDPTETRRDADGGGSYGTVLDLARAIKAEVDAWRSDEEHLQLVINLSLGFDRVFGNDDPADVRALRAALGYASCHGALTVASAGNRIRGPQAKEGPVLPAAWESERAPTSQECSELYGVDIQHDPSEQPLLWAAGALRAGDTALPNSAPLAQPRLLAHGDHAVVEGDLIDSRTVTLTGTSVSAIVVSAAAAAVWYYRPDLEPAQVMNLLAQSGPTLVPSDFCLDHPWPAQCPQNSSRVRLCLALQLACASGQGLCPVEPAFPCFAASSPLATPAADPGNIDVDSMVNCDTANLGQPDVTCPQREYNGAVGRPWTVKSQPDPEPCVTCYRMKDIVYFEVSREHEPMTEAVLTIDYRTYPLTGVAANPQPGQIYYLNLKKPGIGSTDPWLNSSISMKKATKNESVTCPLYQGVP